MKVGSILVTRIVRGGDRGMNVLAIQHDAADPPAAAGELLKGWGHSLEVIRIDRGDAIPTVAEADLLMTFGGGVSLVRGETPAWVADEQALIRQYVSTGRQVVGMCLGGQMIAAALGATVRRNREVEVGWHGVERVASSSLPQDYEWFPQQWMALHWHQDTFDLPAGATHLFRSEACEHQAFAIENRIFGFQFHLEANERTVRTFNQISPLRRRQGPFVQSEASVLEGIETYLPSQTNILERLLRGLWQDCEDPNK